MSVHQQLPHSSKDGATHWMTASSASSGLSIVHVLLGSKSKSELQSNIIQGESLVVGDGAGVFTGLQKEKECNPVKERVIKFMGSAVLQPNVPMSIFLDGVGWDNSGTDLLLDKAGVSQEFISGQRG